MAAGGGSFTLEEAAYLRSLSAVSEVSPVRITYSEEFKRSCVRRYKAGESPARIFREAGLDPSLIGYKRIERCVARWKASGKYADASEQADDAPQDAGADETPGVDSITTDERKYDNWLNGQSLSAADIAFASLRRRGGGKRKSFDVRDLIIYQQVHYIGALERKIRDLEQRMAQIRTVQPAITDAGELPGFDGPDGSDDPKDSSD